MQVAATSVNRAVLVLLPLLAASAAATSAAAQTAVTGQPATGDASSATSGGQNAVTRPNTDHAGSGTPAGIDGRVTLEKGANSFTESEARSRLEKAGYHDVKDLKKDGDGIWRASAALDGKPVAVGLDFKGNVAAQ